MGILRSSGGFSVTGICLKLLYIMDILTAKQIRIEDYLHTLEHVPVRRQGVNLWYKSPLREETEASFKVNTEQNQWYDFDAPIQVTQ